MNDFMKQDIFFFVTTIAVVVVGLLLAILIVYLIKISKDVKYISRKAKTEADLISEDISQLRSNMKTGMKLKHLFTFFNNLRKKK
jgi:MFS-type transporter involved in bile tolerance (Atg22 family)